MLFDFQLPLLKPYEKLALDLEKSKKRLCRHLAELRLGTITYNNNKSVEYFQQRRDSVVDQGWRFRARGRRFEARREEIKKKGQGKLGVKEERETRKIKRKGKKEGGVEVEMKVKKTGGIPLETEGKGKGGEAKLGNKKIRVKQGWNGSGIP